MKRVARSHVSYCFSRSTPPVVEVGPGESILFETLDAASGRVRRASDIYAYVRTRRPENLNPVTGPVAVRGAEPGDTLAVEILGIALASQGYRVLVEGSGVITSEMRTPQALIVVVEGGYALYDGIKLPVRPMVGTIGTAPAGGDIATIHPGPHGGNMDLNHVTIGARVYLPVEVPGALLSLGDVHASMGDGELTGGGIDIDAEVAVRVDVVKGRRWPRPWVETRGSWVTYGYGPTVEEALRLAARDMVGMLSERLGVSRERAFMMIGSHGDAGMGQASASGIDVTVALAFPKVQL